MILLAIVSTGISLIGVLLALACRRLTRRRWPKAGAATAIVLGASSLPALSLSFYLVARLVAGQPPTVERSLGHDITYRRIVLTVPNRAVIHVIEIPDPQRRQFVVTPPFMTTAGPRNAAGYAVDAINGLDADVVINGNFFTPFHDTFLFDSYPAAGDFIEPIGPAIADGVRYGRAKLDWPSLFQTADGAIEFGSPVNATSAVTGRQFLLREGRFAVSKDEPPYPRTAVAMDAARRRLWLVVVDGKQPRYSDGLTLGDLARFLAGLGAADAIELDGGGSSVMVARNAGAPELLSRPCHAKIPGRQRPSGVFLGIRERP